MSTEIRHFVLPLDGVIREFTAEEADLIASGSNTLPEFAESRVRYLRVSWEDASATELKIQTAGAAIKFDANGKLAEAVQPSDDEKISRFEHDTCVQWALRNFNIAQMTIH